MTPIVDIRRLSFAYPGGPLVLREFDFRMMPDETVAIVGPNGAGKSTLMLHMNGVLPETNGRRQTADDARVWIDGSPLIAENLFEIRRKVGLVFQDPDDQLFSATILEDVMFGPMNLRMSPEIADRVARESLDRVGLSGLEERAPHQLSVGQRKRACLAGVLACDPRLLVLDEPTSHLDPRGRREFIELLASLSIPKIIATHDLEMALDLATRIVIVDSGRVHADGPPRTILSDVDLMFRHGLEVPLSLGGDAASPRSTVL